jgi:hypothetical protein
MSARGSIILSRFPRHLELDDPGKRAGAVVATLANDLDVQLGQLGDIRRAHRLADTPTPLDILRSAGLHGIGDVAAEPVARRLAAIAKVIPAETLDEATIDELSQLITVDASAFGEDEAAAWSTIATALVPLTEFSGGLEPLRDVVRGVIAVHRSGNGTPRGLLEACAAYLGLVTEDVAHSDDRWWHLATGRDLLAPRPVDDVEEPARDLLAVEENPPQAADVGPVDRRHGECFAIVRGGLEAVPVDVVVTGKADRTIGPMVVNCDTGSGVVFEDVVPDGSELRFFADGRVQLDGTSVGVRSYSFRGSVFADEGGPVATDFVFAADDDATTGPPLPVEAVLPHHTAYWAVTEPVADAFDGGGAYPHADGLVEPAWLARGRTRWAVFVSAATFALRSADGEIEISQPRYEAGVFDRSVFEPDPAGPPSLGVGFEWQEREPFAVRVWIPSRFSALDTDGEIPVRDRLRGLLDRHRAAGVHVRVEYADPRWVLGAGTLRNLDSTHPLGIVVAGTTLWADDTEQPTD